MEFIINNIFNFIGVASFIIGVLAFLDGRTSKNKAKSEKEINKYIYETAFKNMNVDITSEQIEELNKYKSELQDTIENKLPQIARQNNIKNKIVFHKEQIIKNYKEYEKLCNELENIKDIKLPDNILQIIADKLMPEEAQRREQEKNIILLFVIFIMYIIINNIPFFNNLSLLFLLPIYKPVTSLMESHFTNIRNIKCKISYIFIGIISFYIFIYLYIMMDSFLSFRLGYKMEIAIFSNFYFVMLFVCSSSFICFMTSILLLFKDIITNGNTRHLIKKYKIRALSIIYIFLLLLFLISIYNLSEIARLNSAIELEIYGKYATVKVLVLLILASCSTMIIIPILNFRNVRKKS